MSYNGIGLKSSKGSATSGYIQRNVSDAKNRKNDESEGKHYYKRQLVDKRKQKVEKQKRITDLQIDKDILDHEKKREIEVKVMEYRDKIENEHSDIDDNEIDTMLDKYRISLIKAGKTKNLKRTSVPYNSVINPFSRSERKKNSTHSENKGEQNLQDIHGNKEKSMNS